MPEKRLNTFVSPVFVRDPGRRHQLVEFRKDENSGQLCLLDDLLGGGIVIPDSILDPINAHLDRQQPIPDDHSGIFMLLVGPPGSGKTTLALELCYRLAKNPNSGLGTLGRQGISSIFLSAESPTNALLQNASSYGWDSDAQALKLLVPWEQTPHPAVPRVFVFGRDMMTSGGTQGYLNAQAFFEHARKKWNSMSAIAPHHPRVLVVDSLNVLPTKWEKDDVLSGLLKSCLPGNILMIAVLDSKLRSEEHHYWEYFADIELCLGQEFDRDYLNRKLYIVKARYQDHADGEHRLKINPKPTETAVQGPMSPYIQEGGVFVFPSVHRHLSVARAELGTTPVRLTKPLPTPMQALNEVVEGGGFPAGSCTAIVGSRGGMKSHLAYYTLLNFLYQNPSERALIISLRDPEDAAQQTLAQILANQRDDEGVRLDRDCGEIESAQRKISEFLTQDRLEILFFWPGYISPDEFFQLVRVAVDRAPEGRKPAALVLVNGLEQLNARFPLCAKEEMFVSGLVTLLRVKGTTSIVVSGGEASAPPERQGLPAGLLPMADLIIESSFRLVSAADVWSTTVWNGRWSEIATERKKTGLNGDEAHVIYQIAREPGARECRRRVLFYMGRQNDPKPLIPGSVVVRPLPDGFPNGRKPD